MALFEPSRSSRTIIAKVTRRTANLVNIELSLKEARIIGALIEKEIATPDQYPLSLNALASACNQKSNREPVLCLEETEVQETVDILLKKRLLMEKSGFGSRVAKLQHRFCNSEFGELQFTAQELGVICVLLLRGPQTPGELRSRTSRLCKFADSHEVESALVGLSQRRDGPFVIKLPCEAGRREARYAHLFSGRPDVEEQIDASVSEVGDIATSAATHADRLSTLETQLADLRAEVATLMRRLDQLPE